MGTLLKLSPPSPGIVTEVSDYQAQMRYTDGDLIRFRNTFPEKIGGWEERDASIGATVNGTIRSILSGITNLGQRWAMYGTNTHVYLENGQALYDVTPYRTATNTLTNPFATGSAGTSTITVTWASHGILATSPPSRVVIASIGSGTVDGVTIATGEYFATVVSANTFTITPVSGTGASISGTASSGSTSGGGSVNIRALTNNGPDDSTLGFGWGASTYGLSTWNTARSTAISQDTRVWSFDLWGEDIVGSTGDGTEEIYYWDVTNLTSRGVTLSQYVTSIGLPTTGIPTKVGRVLVSTPDRHLIAFGCEPEGSSDFDPLTVRFASQETLNIWNADELNSAGDQRLGTGSTIAAVRKSKGQMLIWTDQDLYVMQFIGLPFTFSFNQLGTRSGALSVNSVSTVEGIAYWIGENNFYVYDGSIKVLPCPVHNLIYGGLRPDSTIKENISMLQSQKVFSAQVAKYNEIWWFYGADVTNIETGVTTTATDINRYVIYNYVDQTWSIGQSLLRTAWEDSDVFDTPIAADISGDIFDQETGFNNNGSAMTSFIQTGYFNGDESGDQVFFMDRIIPDTTFAAGNTIKTEINTKKYPNDTNVTTKGPFSITSTQGKLDFRSRGRAFQVKIFSDAVDTQWRLGTWRVRGQPDGTR